MKVLISILSIALAIFSIQACKDGNCHPICAAEKKDPTNQLTFNRQSDLEKINVGFEKDDEKFEFVHEGKCVPPAVCPKTIDTTICALPEIGVCGEPKCFANFCELNKYNCDNPDAEYEYYHDEDCNGASLAVADDCSCLECEKESWRPVCSIPADPCGRPVTFSNYCWLQKFNCEVPQYQFHYFHEGQCYTDETAN